MNYQEAESLIQNNSNQVESLLKDLANHQGFQILIGLASDDLEVNEKLTGKEFETEVLKKGIMRLCFKNWLQYPATYLKGREHVKSNLLDKE